MINYYNIDPSKNLAFSHFINISKLNNVKTKVKFISESHNAGATINTLYL